MTNILHGSGSTEENLNSSRSIRTIDWGQIDMQFQVDSGMVVDVAVYSDSLKPDVIGQIPEQLKDQKYNNQLMADQIGRLHSEDEQEEKMFRDIEGWIRKVEL